MSALELKGISNRNLKAEEFKSEAFGREALERNEPRPQRNLQRGVILKGLAEQLEFDGSERDEPTVQMNASRGVFMQRLTEQHEFDTPEPDEPKTQMSAQRAMFMQGRTEQLEYRPLEAIAAMIRNLTYGEMIALAEGLWSVRAEGSDISKDSLPGLLYRWSTAH